MSLIADIMKNLQENYSGIKYNIFSGNAEDVLDKLDKGLLDFALVIEPVDLEKYDYLTLPTKDVWGVVMRKDSELAKKEVVCVKDLINIPLLTSRQMSPKYSKKSGFLDWFGDSFDKLNIVATHNLIYNAAIMVKSGLGYAVTLDKLVNTSDESELCFRELYPKLESQLDIVWKKQQTFSPASKLFLKKLKESFLK